MISVRDRWFSLILGAAVALLLFRPQYALPMLGLLFLGRHWRSVGTACIGATIVYAINAAMAGPGWISIWINGVRPLLKADVEPNAVNEIAPVGFLHAVLGADSTIAMIVSGAIFVGIGLALFAVLIMLDRQLIDVRTTMAIWVVGLIQLFKEPLGVSPLAPVVLALFALFALILSRLWLAQSMADERVLPIQDS
ncbi:MAG: hypothetical protein ACKVIY_06420 [Acidimicrobiales bacterium]